MADVFDVAAYILPRVPDITALKLQKLVYYAQAWSLAWRERELFPQQIEAWAGGPVCPSLYNRHRGQFRPAASAIAGVPSRLTQDECDTIDRVIEFYGKHTAQWLSDLTHLEAPWINARARANALPGENCSETITIAEMAEYYTGLMANASAQTVS